MEKLEHEHASAPQHSSRKATVPERQESQVAAKAAKVPWSRYSLALVDDRSFCRHRRPLYRLLGEEPQDRLVTWVEQGQSEIDTDLFAATRRRPKQHCNEPEKLVGGGKDKRQCVGWLRSLVSWQCLGYDSLRWERNASWWRQGTKSTFK
jgi:hypothetical protein